MNKLPLVLAVIVLLAIIGAGIYFFTSTVPNTETPQQQVTDIATTADQAPADDHLTVLGKSVEGRDITAYEFGSGDTDIVFVGGIHGGYSWNTALVAYDLMDYLEANPNVIPANVKVSVIPVLNPDGLNKTVGTAGRFSPSDAPTDRADTVAGRFNANNVDLNRNFDCDWNATGTWQNRSVSGGTAAFSEPESQAFRTYIDAVDPAAVIVWYSAAGGVFASNCHAGVLPETTELMETYAQASGYAKYASFDFYEITGDLVNWLAKNQVPAISVLLTTHDDIEANKNRAGARAVIESYAN